MTNNKSKAVFPGSFDLVTLGHIDILKRGLSLFDSVVIAVLHNPAKQNAMFTVDERMEILREVTRDFRNVEVLTYNGLLAEFAQAQGISFILRGLRSETDAAYELPMAQNNRLISEGQKLETIMLVTDPAYARLSSSLVREIASLASKNFDLKTLKQLLPSVVIDKIEEKIRRELI